MTPVEQVPFPIMLGLLKASGEISRLRILALLADGELNVTDLTEILGQSQPRISRHLKLLVEAGLVERIREGSWAFFRLAEGTLRSDLMRDLLARLDPTDRGIAADRNRLVDVRRARASQAAAYFAKHAADWDRIRALHAPDSVVETALRAVIGDRPVHALLDLGTGTGRMLELFAPLADRAVGVDGSAEMLALARANIERAGLRNAVVRQGDLFALPVEQGAYDLVIIHQVLHFLDDGARALREAARTLRPGGRMVVVDFAPHEIESLREEAAHRRLGFSREAVEGWLSAAGLSPQDYRLIDPPDPNRQIGVAIWTARDPRILGDAVPISLEVA
jgi:ubiquinone/menaquinone biosynthesis C-methylase UbiE/DNA-binding transcriptional ArsR family regulator